MKCGEYVAIARDNGTWIYLLTPLNCWKKRVFPSPSCLWWKWRLIVGWQKVTPTSRSFHQMFYVLCPSHSERSPKVTLQRGCSQDSTFWSIPISHQVFFSDGDWSDRYESTSPEKWQIHSLDKSYNIKVLNFTAIEPNTQDKCIWTLKIKSQ